MSRWLLTALAVVTLAVAAPSCTRTEGDTVTSKAESTPASTPVSTGRVAVNGVELHYEIHGEGEPLIMLHGGVNPSDFFGAPLAEMAKTQKVIAIHMRGHGLSTDADAPWTYEQMADDVAAAMDGLGIAKADFMGWSLGAGVALQTAIRHPEKVDKLIAISMNFRGDAYFPEIKAEFEAMPGRAAEYARGVEQSPLAKLYPEVDWERMFRKTGEMNDPDHDWSEGVAGIRSPTLLIFADADMMRPEHMVEFYKLMGGGTRDAGIDGSKRPTPNQMAIIPGTTHYDLMLKATGVATGHAKAFLADAPATTADPG